MKKSFTAKLWSIMNACAVQAVLAITLCGVTLSHPNYAQLLDKEVTLHVVDVPFENALKELEKVARIQFAYSVDQLETEPDVTLAIEKRALRFVLDELLRARNIQYRVHEKDAVITLKKVEPVEKIDAPPAGSQGSMRTRDILLMQISGSVKDEATGVPMAGVSVLVKGTTNGTTTDAEGLYTVGAEENDVLVFSFIGYVSVEVPVSARTVIDVTMKQDALNLGEVVVNAGYWEVKDRERTGNISRVSAKAIANQPVQNPMAAIQGRMTGVYVVENSGTPGSGFRIQIRGRNSLREDGNDPLYVIDGVPYTANSLLQINPTEILTKPSPLSIINPSDIESIEVLKDADATAIYGSRGANGVVLITTAKGRSEHTGIKVDIQGGLGSIPNRMDLLSTEQYLEMRSEAFANDGRSPGSADYDVNGAWDSDRYTDWQDVLFGGTARFTTAQLSISAGSENTRFVGGCTHNRQTTVHPGDMHYSRSSVHLNLNHSSANERFGLNLTSTGGLENNNLSPVDFFRAIYTLPPNAPALYSDDGRINWQGGSWTNPIASLERDYNARTLSTINSLQLSYKVFDNLTMKSAFGYNNASIRERLVSPIAALNPVSSNLTGSATFTTVMASTWIAEPQMELVSRIGQGTLTALAGFTFQENTMETIAVSARGIENDQLLYSISAAPADGVSASNSEVQYRYSAVFGRLHYDLKEKYILNLTGRRDGSSRFGPGRRFANFGALGIAWIVSNEQFFKGLSSLLSFAKLRGSYGITGSDQIGNYGFLDTYTGVETWEQYEGGATLVPSRLANPDYGWESNKKMELGLQLAVFKNRMSFSISYYRNRSSDQLVGLPLPATAGFNVIQYNLPATVQNVGWEFELESRHIQSKDVTWSTSVNLSIPRNKLIEYPNLGTSPNARRYKIGYPIEGFGFAYNYLAVDPEDGVYEFEDQDGNDIVTEGDQIVPYTALLNFHGGVVNTLSYKGFQLEMMFHYVRRTSGSHRMLFNTPGVMGPQPTEVLSRWRATGDVSSIAKFTSREAGETHAAHGRWMYSTGTSEDVSFLKLRNVALSWQLPTRWMRSLRLDQGRLYVQGRNLFSATKYKGLDPETAGGVPLRTVVVGVEITL